MQNLSANVAVTIIMIVAVGVSAAILVLRDRWRDRTGMEAEERERLDQSQRTWFWVFIYTLFGLTALVQFAGHYRTPEGRRWGLGALAMLVAGFFSWKNGRRRRGDGHE